MLRPAAVMLGTAYWRRTNVVGIFSNDASIARLVGAMMLEQSDEWGLNRRSMQPEAFRRSAMLRRLGCPL